MSFGNYPALTGTVSTTAKTELAALLETLKTFIVPVDGKPMPHTDFDRIHPVTAKLLGQEIDQIKTRIAAAP